MNDKPLLICREISKHYQEGNVRIDVLQSVNFELWQGDCIAIVGASGSGKTTLLQILGSLDQPSSGELSIAGCQLLAMTECERSAFRNKHLGFIYQFHHLLPEFDALENVTMPLLIRGLSHKKAREQATVLITRVGLKDRLTHRVGELSGGERQRIAIARALVTNPSCVLADEPTGNLDQATADQVFEVMMAMNREYNTSFVMVTHNDELAKKHDRIFMLKHGKLIAEVI